MSNYNKAKLFILLVLTIALHHVFDIGMVEGLSMTPTITDGPNVILIFDSPFYHYEKGDIVLSKNDRGTWVVKRIKWIDSNYCFLEGDNKELSYDSRHYGPVPAKNIKGIVIDIPLI